MNYSSARRVLSMAAVSWVLVGMQYSASLFQRMGFERDAMGLERALAWAAFAAFIWQAACFSREVLRAADRTASIPSAGV